jgi:hypothetical protein
MEDPADIARQSGTGHQGENCAFGAAEIEAVERVCAFIDTLCAALLAEFYPRTWFGTLFRRHVVDPLAARICAALGGMRDRLREIAAEGFCVLAPSPVLALAPAPAPRGAEAPAVVGRTSDAPSAGVGAASEAAHDPALMRPTAPAARSGETSAGVEQRAAAGRMKARSRPPLRPTVRRLSNPAGRPAPVPSSRDGPPNGELFWLNEWPANSHDHFVTNVQ